jgi:hypothetical protein
MSPYPNCHVNRRDPLSPSRRLRSSAEPLSHPDRGISSEAKQGCRRGRWVRRRSRIGLSRHPLAGGLRERHLAATRDEFRELQLALGALKNENQSLRLILENLRVTQRGERGIDGDRGPPGRDGRDGEGRIGPRGERGEQGKAAPTIVAWALDDAAFSATPILGDGGTAATLRLRGMFESFNDAINAEDDAAEADAARAQRTELELEITRQRIGLPR